MLLTKGIFLSIILIICITATIVIVYLPSSTNLVEVRNDITPILLSKFKEKKLEFGNPIFIRIFKEEAGLEVWVKHNDKFELFKTYPICTYSGDLGPKLKEGDGQSPEGFYYVTPSLMNPNSSYHLSFNLGFPNKYDRSQGRTGSYLMVHGKCVSIGCYAMTDKWIEEIYLLAEAALENNQKFFRVHIFPFRMTDSNMRRYKNSKWIKFWENLKEGYDAFERNKKPPKIEVKNRKYLIE